MVSKGPSSSHGNAATRVAGAAPASVARAAVQAAAELRPTVHSAEPPATADQAGSAAGDPLRSSARPTGVTRARRSAGARATSAPSMPG
jgi:hypothetical protein